MKTSKFWFVLSVICFSLITISAIGPLKSVPLLALQNTPQATLTPTATVLAPSGDWVWVARLIDVQPNAVLGGGAIVRIYVQNESERIVELQQGELTLTGTTGTKPEYGPDAVEFAPVPPGRWFVWVPALGPSMALQTDDTSLFIVEFARVPAEQATAIAQASATATPIGGQIWQGQQTSVTQGPSAVGALLRVKVEGVSGLPVDVSTFTDFIGQAVTGHKPDDLPSDVAEIAGLSPGTYIITPHGLNTQLTLDLAANTTVMVEFKAVPPPSATPTVTPLPPTATPRPSNTPTPTPTPRKRWVAAITDRSEIKLEAPVVVIQIDGETDQTITLSRPGASFEETCRTTATSGNNRSSCRINGDTAGEYRLNWEETALSIPLWLNPAQAVWVNISQEVAPAGETIWQGQLNANTNRPLPSGQETGRLNVQIDKRVGQVVTLSNSRGERWLCETDEAYQCTFDELKAGVYTIVPANLTSQFRLYVDGAGQAQVNFAEIPAPLVTATPISGRGAIQRRGEISIGAVKATPTASNTPTQTSTPTATPIRRATATPRPQTPTPTAEPTATPTVALAWVGQIVEQYSHPGQMLVVRAPLHGHPVLIQSGPWQTEGLTGSKPEHGEGAVEFSGLASGNYTINLVGLGETTVNLPVDQFMVVQFNYQVAPTPTPTPVPGQWTAAVINNTSGSEDGGGAWSILTIEVAGAANHPVQISTDGFETECITGSKPELGASACQVGGLWPATYRVQPVDLPIHLDVTLDGRGYADVAFWQQ